MRETPDRFSEDEFSLIDVVDPADWQAYHDIRRTVLFDARGLRGYDANSRRTCSHQSSATLEVQTRGRRRHGASGSASGWRRHCQDGGHPERSSKTWHRTDSDDAPGEQGAFMGDGNALCQLGVERRWLLRKNLASCRLFLIPPIRRSGLAVFKCRSGCVTFDSATASLILSGFYSAYGGCHLSD